MHIERLAAGMADLNECVLRWEPSYSRRWPLGKLLLNAAGLALALAAICSPLWWAS